jgi:colicin import membrane protein
MGKDSLIKSTTKKKTTAKKSDGAEKTKKVKADAAKKPKAAKTKSVPKAAKTKSAPKPKAVTKKKTTAKIKKPTAAKPKARKTAAPQKAKLTIQDLIMKSFDPWKPDKLYTVPDKPRQTFDAPSFLSGMDDTDAQRLKKILFRRFDLTAPPEKTTAAEAVEEIVPKVVPAPVADDARSPSVDTPSDIKPPVSQKVSDPSDKIIKYGVAVFVLLIALIVGASIQNQSRYFIIASDGAVDVWQGKFSPMGKRLIISLPGATMPKTQKSVYTKKEAMAPAFNYYIEKADALLTVEGMPDFTGIKSSLNRALIFATSDDLRSMAKTRINTIDLMILLYKADVSGTKGTLKDLTAALAYLEEAATFGVNAAQEALIREKINGIKAEIAKLKKKQPVQAKKEKT